MSKVIFLSFPYHGHINFNIPIIKELAERGEEVIFYSDIKFRERVEATGASFRTYFRNGYNIDKQNEGVGNLKESAFYDIAGLSRTVRNTFTLRKIIFEDVYDEILSENPDYIIHDSCAIWGKEMAQRLNKYAIACYSNLVLADEIFDIYPDYIYKTYYNFLEIRNNSMNRNMAERIFSRFLKNTASEFGVENIEVNKLFNAKEDLNLVFAHKWINPFSEYLDDSFKFILPSLDENNINIDFPFEQLENKDVIYIAFGTVFNIEIEFYKLFIKAFKDTDMTVVMAIGEKNDLSAFKDVPSNCIIRNFVPQREILKMAKVFISHGGRNSVYDSVYNAAPLILIPFYCFDQYINAEKIEELNAGIYIRDLSFTPEEIRNTVYSLIDNKEIRENCIALQKTARNNDGSKQAVDEIMNFKVLKMIG